MKTIESVEVDLDAEYPRRKYERECDAQEWLQGWTRLKVDADWLDHIAANMGAPAVANAAT